jgi:hypothetical protein
MARLLIPILLSFSALAALWWASSACRRRGHHAPRLRPSGLHGGGFIYDCEEDGCKWSGTSLEAAGFPAGWASEAAIRRWDGQ